MFQQAASCCFRSLHQLLGQNQLHGIEPNSFFSTDPLKAPPSVLLFPAHSRLTYFTSSAKAHQKKKAETCTEAAKMADDDEKKILAVRLLLPPPSSSPPSRSQRLSFTCSARLLFYWTERRRRCAFCQGFPSANES
jgi:hypothetical protein